MALDWAKAFDAVSPTALCIALRRFGVPMPFVSLISQIYSDRKFRVQCDGNYSNYHSQHFGVSQGCPLSSFLLSMLMTVLMQDCKGTDAKFHDIEELLYADDTLLLGYE